MALLLDPLKVAVHRSPPSCSPPLPACFLASVFLAAMGGCDIPPRPILAPDAGQRSTAPAEEPSGLDDPPTDQESAEPAGTYAGQWETWDALLIRNRYVGYAHTIAEANRKAGSANQVRYQVESRLNIKRGAAQLLQRLEESSVETKSGELISFDSSLRLGPGTTRHRGVVRDGVLQIETMRGNSRSTRNLPWRTSYRGLVALEQSLRGQPMEAKEEREFRMLLPGQYQTATTRLTCIGKASVPLLDGSLAELTEIRCEVDTGQGKTRSTIWTDDKGEIVRTYSPTLHLVAHRTDRSTATRGERWDEAPIASIDVTGQELADASQSTRVVYRVAPMDAKRPIPIISLPGQSIQPLPEGAFRVLVSREEGETTGEDFEQTRLEPTEADRRPGPVIDSSDKMVQRYADAAAGVEGMSDRSIALSLAQATPTLVAATGSSAGLSPASEIARNGKGDSIQQAVLLTALLRARKIPARLAVGLRYRQAEGDQGPARMVFHVWSLAYVGDGWIHLDATEGRAAPADRLVISTTALRDESDFDAWDPFLEVIGNLKVEVEETE